jgi:hypothetical protein
VVLNLIPEGRETRPELLQNHSAPRADLASDAKLDGARVGCNSRVHEIVN